MSCHDIGRGMNNVVRTVIKLLDEGKITKEAAKTLIRSCANSVHWCDGNEYEATDYIERCMCGRCMSVIPKGKPLYQTSQIRYDLQSKYSLWNVVIPGGVCEDCFDEFVQEAFHGDLSPEEVKAGIMECGDESAYKSSGEYEDSNNGFRWIDYD